MKNFMSSLLHRNVRTYGVRLGKERDSRFIFLRCNTQNIPKVRLTARVLFSLFKAIVMLDHFFFFIYKYYSLAAEARKGNNHNLLLRQMDNTHLNCSRFNAYHLANNADDSEPKTRRISVIYLTPSPCSSSSTAATCRKCVSVPITSVTIYPFRNKCSSSSFMHLLGLHFSSNCLPRLANRFFSNRLALAI